MILLMPVYLFTPLSLPDFLLRRFMMPLRYFTLRHTAADFILMLFFFFAIFLTPRCALLLIATLLPRHFRCRRRFSLFFFFRYAAFHAATLRYDAFELRHIRRCFDMMLSQCRCLCHFRFIIF